MAAPINPNDLPELNDRVVHINRVAKVVKGGRRFSFSALVVVATGRVTSARLARRTRCPRPSARRRAGEEEPLQDPLAGNTIRTSDRSLRGGRVLLKPAGEGTGVIAGGSVRAVLEAVGIRTSSPSSQGSRNPHNVVKAASTAAQAAQPEEAARRRGRSSPISARSRERNHGFESEAGPQHERTPREAPRHPARMGLTRVGRERVLQDTPAIRGMINKGPTWSSGPKRTTRSSPSAAVR